MAKRNIKAEKRLKNEEYAKKYRKTHTSRVDPDMKRRGGKYANWCRIPGHPPSCNCVYT